MSAADEEHTVTSAAEAIVAAGGAAERPKRGLQLQWNVPEGLPPHIPLWFALLFIGAFALAGAVTVLQHLL